MNYRNCSSSCQLRTLLVSRTGLAILGGMSPFKRYLQFLIAREKSFKTTHWVVFVCMNFNLKTWAKLQSKALLSVTRQIVTVVSEVISQLGGEVSSQCPFNLKYLKTTTEGIIKQQTLCCKVEYKSPCIL